MSAAAPPPTATIVHIDVMEANLVNEDYTGDRLGGVPLCLSQAQGTASTPKPPTATTTTTSSHGSKRKQRQAAAPASKTAATSPGTTKPVMSIDVPMPRDASLPIKFELCDKHSGYEKDEPLPFWSLQGVAELDPHSLDQAQVHDLWVPVTRGPESYSMGMGLVGELRVKGIFQKWRVLNNHQQVTWMTTLASTTSRTRTESATRAGVGLYKKFQQAIRDRDKFFAILGDSSTVKYVPKSKGSGILDQNFRLVRPISQGCSGIEFEVKCIGEGHPRLFRDQSYALKVFNHGTGSVHTGRSFENEYIAAVSTLAPHPNVNTYFCHFTDCIPQEYYDHLPPACSDGVQDRMRACEWVVHEHHSETLEQFLQHINTTAPERTQQIRTTITAPIPTTPWPIVHKYSRDICAALVHLFKNRTIHFDIKLSNIVISSNKEQAILIDLGCAMKFPSTSNDRPFETKTEQPSFELGCILFELAMCGEHPLPGYPGGYGTSGQITFSFEREHFPMKPPQFPQDFCDLVRSLLQCDPEKRMPLLEASEVLSNIESPSPNELLSFYEYVPPANNAGTLTAKAACQILCGAADDCVDTLYKALEFEPSFPPALLLLDYLHSFYIVDQTSGFHKQIGLLTSPESEMFKFKITYMEFTKAFINKEHRATLPELVLTALWTRHISSEAHRYHEVNQLLQKKIPTEQSIASFLRSVMYPRNAMMMEALAHLEVGNIDLALNFVAIAYSLFEREMNRFISQNEDEEPRKYHCDYLPGLLFLFCLISSVNDHVALHQHIPTELSPAFSCALSTTDILSAHCMRVLNSNLTTNGESWPNKSYVLAEWYDLLMRADLKGWPPSQEKRSWTCMYYVALWSTLCSLTESTISKSAARVWYELISDFPGSTSVMSTAGLINWGTSSMSHLGICYEQGLGGVDKDIDKAVSLYQRAADAGDDAQAMCEIAICYSNGYGVDKDMSKAVSWYLRAADAGNAIAMRTLGTFYQNGTGVEKDIHKAVTWWQRAADAVDATAIHNLGTCYQEGDGVAEDKDRAITLFQRAVDSGNAAAMWSLGMCYASGNGVGKDIHKTAVMWQRSTNAACAMWQQTTEAGNAYPTCNLAELEKELLILYKEPPNSVSTTLDFTRLDWDFSENERKKKTDTTSFARRFEACILGLACCDAVGTTVEFKVPGTFEPVTDMVGGGVFHLLPGQWTDDTSLALCVIQSFIEKKTYDPQHHLFLFRKWRNTGFMSSNGKCFDIGNSIRSALSKFSVHQAPYCGSTKGEGSGSLMRLAGVPMFYSFQNPHAALEISADSSRTTHASAVCTDSCRYYGGLIAGALVGKSKEELLSPLFSPIDGYYGMRPLTPKVHAVANGSFKIPLSGPCTTRRDSFQAGCLALVNLGNDSDTAGAIYGQLAGPIYACSPSQGIPQHWISRLAKLPLIQSMVKELFALSTSELPMTIPHIPGSLYNCPLPTSTCKGNNSNSPASTSPSTSSSASASTSTSTSTSTSKSASTTTTQPTATKPKPATSAVTHQASSTKPTPTTTHKPEPSSAHHKVVPGASAPPRLSSQSKPIKSTTQHQPTSTSTATPTAQKHSTTKPITVSKPTTGHQPNTTKQIAQATTNTKSTVTSTTTSSHNGNNH
ncbi:ADP-ribosylglycohydrolase family protein [Pelomyxa schiedti]|nr:ADP-ribosylglycohydrolase family protein [Pelomyxa schiedti]